MFLTIDDLKTVIYEESLKEISREDDTIPEFGIDAAISEMKSYLAPVYDTDTIFAQTGTARHNMLLMFAKDIAAYHIICLSNPGVDFDTKEARYNRAIDYLKAVQSGKVSPDLPKISTESTPEAATIIFGSNPARNNYY
jgi:phage gp36-like protein